MSARDDLQQLILGAGYGEDEITDAILANPEVVLRALGGVIARRSTNEDFTIWAVPNTCRTRTNDDSPVWPEGDTK